MALHSGLDIFGEIGIDCRRRIFRQQGDTLREGSSRRNWRMDYRNRQLATLDHNFRACAHPRQQPSEVAGGFCLRDMNHMVSHAPIIPSLPVSGSTIPTGHRGAGGGTEDHLRCETGQEASHGESSQDGSVSPSILDFWRGAVCTPRFFIAYGASTPFAKLLAGQGFACFILGAGPGLLARVQVLGNCAIPLLVK